MEINFALLQKYNPWWEEKNLIQKDERILNFEKQAIKYFPRFLEREKFEVGVYTLIGPRQVGKSTALKLFVRDLLFKKKIEASHIFFFQCDIIDHYQDLIQVLEVYLQSLDHTKEIYVFLDEISFVEEWPRAIKHLIDRGDLKKAIIFLTGSLSLQVKGGAELLPGRRGKKEKQDFLLLPLDFSEYLAVQKLKGLSFNFNLLLEESPQKLVLNPVLNRIYSQKYKIEVLFKEYLLTGGFLLSLNEFKKTKKISDNTFHLYWQWIKGDLLKIGRNENIFLEIIQETIKHLGSTLSYNDITKNTPVQSHLTTMDYLDLGQKLFLLNIFYNIDLAKRLPALRKQKKVTFLDPFLFHLLNGQVWGHGCPILIFYAILRVILMF